MRKLPALPWRISWPLKIVFLSTLSISVAESVTETEQAVVGEGQSGKRQGSDEVRLQCMLILTISAYLVPRFSLGVIFLVWSSSDSIIYLGTAQLTVERRTVDEPLGVTLLPPERMPAVQTAVKGFCSTLLCFFSVTVPFADNLPGMKLSTLSRSVTNYI